MRAFGLILLSGLLVACGDEGGEEVELSGVIALYESASPHPDFAENCSGQGEYALIRGGARITITSGDVMNYTGELSDGRGGENRQCEVPFSGTLVLADEYTVEVSFRGESVSTTCGSDHVAVHERGTLGDIAFFTIQITDAGMECRIPAHLR
jgi:hypothetical protein